MARIYIPVEFEFRAEKAIWRAGVAKPVGWSNKILGGPVLEVVEPFAYEGFHAVVSEQQIPELSQEIRACVGDQRWETTKKGDALRREMERVFGQHKIEVLICDSPNRRDEASLNAMGLGRVKLPTKAERIDAWKLREEFFRVKRNTADLVRFLNRWGNWSPESAPKETVALIFPDSIWSDQDRFRNAPQSEPLDWLSLREFDSRPEFPHFVRRASTCREAIESTIIFDFVRGSKFRLCALKDCRLPFKLESDHKRKFCSQYHAHLDSVRRNRKLAARAKRKESSKSRDKGAGGTR